MMKNVLVLVLVSAFALSLIHCTAPKASEGVVDSVAVDSLSADTLHLDTLQLDTVASVAR